MKPLAAARAADPALQSDWPSDAVEVGRIVGAFGVKGWIRVLPHGRDARALLQARPWYLQALPPTPGADAQRSVLAIQQAKVHSDTVIAQPEGCADRDQAEALRGAGVFVSRARFPAAGADEYYWVDLIGAEVINRQGQLLGTVSGLLDTGANDVLCVASTGSESAAERLIPFVAAYVDEVDLAARRVVVDWGLDY